ncbi:hypothetical protein AAVH_30488, partial [Aphelenchoides avenae]
EPNYNAILHSVLEYAALKAATQLVDSYPALLKHLPQLFNRAESPTTTEARSTVSQACAAATPAHAVLVPAARADPLDQRDYTFHVCRPAAVTLDITQVPASLPTPTTRCAPAEAPPLDKSTSVARHASAQAPQLNRPTSVAHRAPAKAPPFDKLTTTARHLPAQAAVQGDNIRVRRTIRNDSPLKNETVCFCDGSTFLYFGCLLRPEVLMILTPMSSFDGAFRSVCSFHPSSKTRNVIFWLSDSDATPLSPAVQFRLAIELSRHYARQYPTLKQHVVATPTIGSRKDVWTCGLFKLLVQMEVVLPYADVIMSTRGS